MADAPVRVLLVDDDEDERVIVGDLLRSACADRFDLAWAPTYERGLEAIRAAECDVCLLDYRLGSRSGLDLLAEVTSASTDIPVILLTGEGDRGVDVTAMKAGAADYLAKSELTGALLERSIRYAVEHGRALKAREANELAQSLNRAKSALLAVMSHEIRTPMNAILGMADMLSESPLATEQLDYLDVLRRAGADLLLLINDILDLSKIDAGHLELQCVAFDLDEVVDQAMELAGVKARAKGIELLAHLPAGVPTFLMGDPTRLRQILIHLLGNAIKFTEIGEVVLTVREASGKLAEIEFAVSDTGIGIPLDKLDRIFEDFIQGDSSITRKYGGTGLGLAISRRLVERMGGRLTVISAVGQGSTFRFTAHFDLAPNDARKIRIPLEDFYGKRALLIDDNPTNCIILRETLQSWGLESDVFRQPAEALKRLPQAMAGKRPYLLAVIDSRMPGMDGFEVAAEIRRIAGELPIVMLTSDARLGDTARRAQTRLSGYAIKPVTRSHLLRLVCDVLETRESPEPPAVSPAIHPVVNVDSKRKVPVRPARILIGEDSPDNRLLVEVYLKESPHRLTFEEDGKATVERFASSDFDLVLMDLQMPVMDGLEATRAIRALERARSTPSIPVIALTANTSLQDIEKSRDAGCTAHLPKPVSKVQLLSAIEEYAGR
jgi:signal transduction histidine kinase